MPEVNSRVLTSPDFHALAQEVLGQGGSFRFRARGRSMMPFVRPGDVLLVEPVDPARLRTGEIILFHQRSTSHVVHRLIRRVKRDGRLVFIAQGDNSAIADAPILAEQVLGRVVGIEREGRRLRLDRGPGQLLNRVIYYLRGLAPWRPRSCRRLARVPWRLLGRLMWRQA